MSQNSWVEACEDALECSAAIMIRSSSKEKEQNRKQANVIGIYQNNGR
jgi:hypothetical protein